MRYRIETDRLGEKQVPAEAYFGIGAQRSKEVYEITKHGLIRQMIKAFANIKKTAAKTNSDLGFTDKEVANAIMLSCDEILNGRLHGQFITDVVQGGSGRSMNANANEVIANRANEIMGGEKGKYDLVSIDIVNLNQNVNEVVLLAGKLSIIRLTKKLLTEAKKLYNAYYDKIEEYHLDVSNNGVAQEINTFGDNLDRNMKRINGALSSLTEISITVPNLAPEQQAIYVKKFVKYLNQYASETVHLSKNVMDNKRNLDAIAWVSTTLRLLSADLSKIATDIQIMDKSNRIQIPEIDTAGRYVVIEMMKQVSFYVMGNDLTISRAVEAGEQEENIFLPIIYACIFEMCNLIRRTLRTLREQVVADMILVGYEKNPAQ
jgi:aspartate ammonia-lyase